MYDDLGDRMKAYERATESVVSSSEYLILRIDGKGFSKYTKKFEKPFDNLLADIMDLVTTDLVASLHASLGYTQSDEITIVIAPKDSPLFGGRVQKLVSVVASMATAYFNEYMRFYMPTVNNLAFFDARVFTVPTLQEAINAVYWRAIDAKRNSVSSAFRWNHGHKEMMNKAVPEMLAYMQEHNTPWESYSVRHRFGTYIIPNLVSKVLDEGTRLKIPEHKRPLEGTVFIRKEYLTKHYDITNMDIYERLAIIK